MKIVEYGSIALAHRNRGIALLCDRPADALMTMPDSLDTLHLTDKMVKYLLGLDMGEFLTNKYQFEQDGTVGGRMLNKAAELVTKPLSYVNGVIVHERNLRCDYDVIRDLFMDREVGKMVDIARFRTARLLRKLAERNPEVRLAVIDDGGSISVMSVEDALRIPAKQLLPAIM